jgi:hypothetical protein
MSLGEIILEKFKHYHWQESRINEGHNMTLVETVKQMVLKSFQKFFDRDY